VRGQRHTTTFHGTLTEARKELRRSLKAGDDGMHIAPVRATLVDWVTEWLELWERKVSAQTLEHYGKLLRVNVLPVLGHRPLEELGPGELDRLYGELAKRLSPRSVHHVHRVLNCCLRTAVKKMRLADNPAARAEAPRAKQSDAWSVLDADQLNTLVRGFKDTPLYGIVCVAAYAGLRRAEILALLWTDIDFIKSTITVRRSIEETVRYGRRTKEPKTDRGKRTIAIDAGLLEILRAEYDQHRRIVAGVGEGAQVDLSLVRLPPNALVFPSLTTPFDFTRLRRLTSVSKQFAKRAAALGFPIRLHDLRHSHGTILLSRGVPIHEVAGRLGHSAAVLLTIYAHRLPKEDEKSAEIIGALTKGL
jgi:integrase